MKRLYQLWITRLSRITTTGRYIPLIDGLRFIAIGTVLIQHIQQIVIENLNKSAASVVIHVDLAAQLIRDWRIGVQLFFVISGFILGLPFAEQYLLKRRKVKLKDYYLRRLTRLEPPYLIAMTLCLFVLLYQGGTIKDLYPHFIASCLYIHNVVYGEFSKINSVAWSLEVEVQFYILAPFIAYLFAISRAWLRRFAIILVSLCAYFLNHLIQVPYPAFPPTLLQYLMFYLAGFLMADIYVTSWGEKPPQSWQWDCLAIPGWLLLPFVFYRAPPMTSLVVCTFILILFYSTFRSVLCSAFLSSPLPRVAGGMCYTVYLIHLRLFANLGDLVMAPTVGSHLILYTLVGTVVFSSVLIVPSVLFFILIEKPCMRKDWPRALRQWLLRFARSFSKPSDSRSQCSLK